MSNVLLVVPAGMEPQRAIATAFDLVRERGGKLVVLIVLDPDLPSRIASTLDDVGFVGEEVGSGVSGAIENEQRAHATRLSQAVTARAHSQGIPITTLVEQGDIGETSRRVIAAHQIGIAVLVAEKPSWLTRFLSRGAAVHLPALAGCEVRVTEED